LIAASDRVTLAAHTLGLGPPLYAVHGGPAADHRSFGEYLDPIASYRELYLLDQRGCGDSEDSPRQTYTLERLAEDIEDTRQHLGHEQVEVLGYSFGCAVALRYACGWPDRLRALVLVDGPIRGWRAVVLAPRAWGLWAGTFWAGLKGEATVTEFHLAHEVASADRRDEVRRLLALPRRYDPARVRPLSMAGGRTPHLPRLIASGLRVLGIFGKQDRRFVREAGYLRSVGADVALIEGAGHFPFAEQPEAFHRALRAFLVDGMSQDSPS
jgi:pimeloyl-ACP methyl ester carboxylesterase